MEQLDTRGTSPRFRAETTALVAVALANAQHYDAVLLDLVLGLERGEDIFAPQSCIAHGHPPIILSAQPEYEIEAVAKRIGATRWLSEPARIGAINAALTAAVKA